jgi:AAA domain, putative AbiEii toxin, Type IV TA system
MYFNVLPHSTRPPAQATAKAYLLTDNWDDWFKFSTLYSLLVFDDEGGRHSIGGVKIGQFGMTEDQRRPDLPERFNQLDERFFSLGLFTNLVSVTFSAFDPFEPLPIRQDKSEGVHYAYIGLKRTGTNEKGKPLPPKSPDALSTDFGASVLVCRQGARASRWRRALEMLEADPIFRDAEVAALAGHDIEVEELKVNARRLFKKLSSGHKIVLLTITRLVETVEEKTLVLLDEPEAHLHPPLLSAFVRALSDLLINRNGVAIIATHSPVVLQEVPRSCVWKVRRAGERSVAERPDVETFGENVGILTREVFGLEVTHSGFHKMLRDAVARDADFDAILEKFSGELGGEARAIVRALLAVQNDDEGEL